MSHPTEGPERRFSGPFASHIPLAKRKALCGRIAYFDSAQNRKLEFARLNALSEFGHIENGGLRCCYHGWLYDVDGKVLETPGEGAGSTFKDRVRQPSYKVQELGGVLFVYMGPEPAPLLPRYDVLAREDGQRAMRARRQLQFFPDDRELS